MSNQGFEKLSVIIPTANEEKHLPECLAALREIDSSMEVILVDGGSSDKTQQVTAEYQQELPNLEWLLSPFRNRGFQLNLGAKRATGSHLLFLHADSVLEKRGYNALMERLKHDPEHAYVYRLRFSPYSPWMCKMNEVGANMRTAWFALPYGDQGLCVPKKLFFSIGGYPLLKMMEDVGIIETLRKQTKLECLPHVLTTSSRKYAQQGWMRTTASHAFFVAKWLCARYSFALEPTQKTQMERELDCGSC